MLVTFACYFGYQITRLILHGEISNSSGKNVCNLYICYYKQRMRPDLVSPDHPTKFPSSEIIKKEMIVILLAIFSNPKSDCILEIKTHQKNAVNVIIINILPNLNNGAFFVCFTQIVLLLRLLLI